jgi:hypothetical protein
VKVRAPTTIHGSRQIGTTTRGRAAGSESGPAAGPPAQNPSPGPAQARSAAASQSGTARPSGPVSSRRIEASACGTDSMTVTHTGTPASRSRVTSSSRFSSWFAITRSGARAMMAARSGFLVPRTRVTVRPAGWVHQSVAPTSRPGAETATASVSDGTSETTRRAGPDSSTGCPRSSRHRVIGYRPTERRNLPIRCGPARTGS